MRVSAAILSFFLSKALLCGEAAFSFNRELTNVLRFKMALSVQFNLEFNTTFFF